MKWPKLYWSRKQEHEFAVREAAGENLWTHEAPEEVRNKILQAVKRSCASSDESAMLLNFARESVLFDRGSTSLSGEPNPQRDFLRALLQADETLLATLVEALDWAFRHSGVIASQRDFQEMVNETFHRHRIAWELVEGWMVPFESKELHTEIVEPTLRLLSHSGWDDVEGAYQKALREIAENHADDAITDAAAAVQETLKLLGCSGNRLDPLAKSAVSQGLLAGYDKKLVEWIEADRSNRGDAHSGQSGATREDAWLVVHAAGALILRLVIGASRST